VFTVRGLLAICASGSLGPLLDRVNHYLLVSIALHVDFVMYMAVTQCRSLTTLLVALGPPEFVNCGIGMGRYIDFGTCLSVLTYLDFVPPEPVPLILGVDQSTRPDAHFK